VAVFTGIEYYGWPYLECEFPNIMQPHYYVSFFPGLPLAPVT